MANPNPYKARLEKRRLRKPGDMSTLRKVLWQALIEAERVLLYAEDDEMTLKAVHAISQASGQYARLLEIGEFEARLKALEDAQLRRNGH